jgi:hypothetical protein
VTESDFYKSPARAFFAAAMALLDSMQRRPYERWPGYNAARRHIAKFRWTPRDYDKLCEALEIIAEYEEAVNSGVYSSYEL